MNDWDAPIVSASEVAPDAEGSTLARLATIARTAKNSAVRVRACRAILRNCFPVQEPSGHDAAVESAYAKLAQAVADLGIHIPQIAAPSKPEGKAKTAVELSQERENRPEDRPSPDPPRTIGEENAYRLANGLPMVNAWRWDAERGVELPFGPPPPGSRFATRPANYPDPTAATLDAKPMTQNGMQSYADLALRELRRIADDPSTAEAARLSALESLHEFSATREGSQELRGLSAESRRVLLMLGVGDGENES